MTRVVREPILDQRPIEATRIGSRMTGCDDDDAVAFASQHYATPASTTALEQHYRDVTQSTDWRAVPSRLGGVCYTKGSGSDAVSFSVRLHAAESNSQPAEYDIVVASTADGAWVC